MISVADVQARVRRLEELTHGLSRELSLWKEQGNDPLLYLERRAYLNAVRDALTSLEAARGVLAQATQRARQDSTSAAVKTASAGDPPPEGRSA